MSEPNTPPGPPPGSPPPSDPPAGSPPPPPSGGGGGTTPGAPPPPPTGGGASGGESPNRGLMIALSYLWLLALIPLLVEKEDREVQWHAKHGLVLFGAEIVVVIVLTILTTALTFTGLDFLGCGGCAVQSIFWLAVLVVHVLCIVKGVNGDRFLIPGISQYADKF